MNKSLWPLPKARFCAILLLGISLGACAGRPQARVQMGIPEIPPPPPPPTPLERAAQRVRQNGRDIEKYFVLGDEGSILVRAMLREEMGDFEVIYDLEGAEALENSVFRVAFIVRDFWDEDAQMDTESSPNSIEDSLIWRPGPGTAGLLIAMDDDYFETWEQHFDFFDEYGARITFFLQGDYSPFSAKALARGHDVGFHSVNHLDLRRLSPEDFAMETYIGAEAFRQEGIPISSYAYPFGFSEPWMHEALRGHFGVLRGYGVTFRIYTEDQIRSGFINSRAIDNTVIRGEENFQRVVNLMLRTLKFLDDGRILPLTTHDISDESWAISQRRLEFLFKTAADLHLKFYLFRDFANE